MVFLIGCIALLFMVVPVFILMNGFKEMDPEGYEEAKKAISRKIQKKKK